MCTKDQDEESSLHAARNNENCKVSFVLYFNALFSHQVDYRNLYAIDFLKDHEVTCDEFAKVWIKLDEATRKVTHRCLVFCRLGQIIIAFTDIQATRARCEEETHRLTLA